MMGSSVNPDARNIVGLIERGTVGAEIGVWKGNTSKLFAGRGVSKLHLVDAWSVEPYQDGAEHGSLENYLERYSNLTGGNTVEQFKKYYDNVYTEVKKMFMGDNRVIIHRTTSDEFFANLEEKLDWIYVDADHSYEGCLRDLNNALKSVKAGGLIIGDDYKWPGAVYGKVGVTKAVDEFCRTNGLLKTKHGQIQFSIRV